MKKKMKSALSLLLSVCLIFSLFIGNASAAGKTFPDSAGHWAEDIIKTLAEQGVIAGFPDGTVRPDSIISRAEFSALLVRYMKINTAEAGEKARPLPTLTAAGRNRTLRRLRAPVSLTLPTMTAASVPRSRSHGSKSSA
jgi:hypothetical protein